MDRNSKEASPELLKPSENLAVTGHWKKDHQSILQTMIVEAKCSGEAYEFIIDTIAVRPSIENHSGVHHSGTHHTVGVLHSTLWDAAGE